MFFSDENYLYALAHKSKNNSSGFRLYDMENMIEADSSLSYNLTKV